MTKIAITSGFFNPIHEGHLNLLREAKELADYLFVVVNNDKQVSLKGGAPFMIQDERIKIVASIKYVDFVFISIDEDGTVKKTLLKLIDNIKKERVFNDFLGKSTKRNANNESSLFRKNDPIFFVKGGDSAPNNTPEKELLPTIFGVGGKKIQSSSWLKETHKRENRNK